MRRRNGQLLSGKKEATNSLLSASLATEKKIMAAAGKLLRILEDGKPLAEVLEAKQNL